MSMEGASDIPTKNNECVLHRHIDHEFVVVFITYYTFDLDMMDVLYRKVLPAKCT